MGKKILQYQQKCYYNYRKSIYLPHKYAFPEGNDIQPLLPFHVATNSLMIIGAYPSARYEYRKSIKPPFENRLIPIANNLCPFSDEQYFDGVKTRELNAGRTIREFLLEPLGKEFKDCWITNLVKVFLYEEKHAENCEAVGLKRRIPVLRDEYLDLGKRSLAWIKEEIELCKPKLIITLGQEVAEITSGGIMVNADNLLSEPISNPYNLYEYPTIHVPHPEDCRRNKKLKKILDSQIEVIKKKLV